MIQIIYNIYVQFEDSVRNVFGKIDEREKDEKIMVYSSFSFGWKKIDIFFIILFTIL